MTSMSERINKPISTAEMERRWRAVRAVMESEGIDVLLMQSNNDHMGGTRNILLILRPQMGLHTR